MSHSAVTFVRYVGVLAIILLGAVGALATVNALAHSDLGMWDMMDGGMHGMMGQGGPETTGSASGEGDVQIADFSFQPTVLTVTPRTTVRWTNEDSAPHTATGDAFDTGRLAQGESGQMTFETGGTYEYKCEFHSYMVGKIVVSSTD